MATPATAAAWASAATEACGLASQPNTSAWTKAAPVSFERRCTKPVARAAASAVVVNTVCRVWASCGTVVIRRLLRRYKVSHILIVPKDLSDVFVTLMRKGAMNPCPCGYHGDPTRECGCSPGAVARYQKRLSGPLLDRIDVHVEVPRVVYDKLAGPTQGEPSAAIRARVQVARVRQAARLAGSGR